MPESGRDVTAIAPKMGQMGRKWPEMAEDGLKMAETGRILAVIVQKMSQNGRHMAKNYR